MKTLVRLMLGLAIVVDGRTAAANPVESIAYQNCWVDYWDTYSLWCNIWVTTADGSSHLLMENGIEPAWSPDGSRIAFSRFNPGGGIVVLEVVTGTLTDVTGSEGGRGAAWSPDGSRILFRGGDAGADLLVANADGTGVVPLTTSGDVEGRPAWSPDGSRIAYGCLGASGTRDICAMNADGTGLVQLTDDPATDSDPAFSPDGTTIAFTRGGGIAIMTSEGADLHPLVYGYWPAWSPDGSRIAFSLPFEGACDADGRLCYDYLNSINADGTGEQNVATGSHPSWTASAQLVRPVASRWEYCEGAYCRFFSTSWDMNGTIVGEEWDFGDGTTGSGATTEHVYSVSGTYDVTLTVTDNDGLTATLVRPLTVVVYVPPPPPVPPVAAFSVTCAEAVCAFDGTASFDPNGTIASYAWGFSDGGNGSGPTATHTYTADGTYAVSLMVTDNDGLSDTVSHVLTMTIPRSHVGDLDGSVTSAGSSWTARVTAVVHERGEARLANATLTGNWSIGGSSSCTTNAAGECAVSKPSIPNKTRNVTFTVTGVTHATRLYVAGENHDPDGDSTGTAITVNR